MTKPLMRVVNKKGVLGAFSQMTNVNAASMERGLVMGGLLVQSSSMKQTPVDTGALRASHRIKKLGSGLKTRVKISVMQSYSIYVHEDLNAKHAPGTNAKFLERALRQNRKRIRALIKAG